MDDATATGELRAEPSATVDLGELSKRSDARGLARLTGHAFAVLCTGAGYHWVLGSGARSALAALAAVPLGFTLVTFFAAMHETVHRTAFATRWLNDAVAWVSGLLSFYNSSFYRPYHGWHHRFTQLSDRDPELQDPKPTSLGSYLLELSALPWWLGKLKTYALLVAGRTSAYPFLTEQSTPVVVRSVRAQMLAYAGAIALSFAVERPLFFVYWLAPVALAQPFLRAILLAEHTGCSNDDDPLTNTRTTHTIGLVRFLMWEMPYHAEHHRYPALPFFALERAHAGLGPSLQHVARHGYLGFHRELLATFNKEPTRD
jgi:fatty acid desaturase